MYRAMRCTALTGPAALSLEQVEEAAPGPGEVRVQVRAIGVNYPDLLMTRGAYQLRLEPPFTPGMEVAGEILETGPSVNGWSPGDRVIALMRHGGYAEQVVVPEDALIPLPTPFGFDEGATFHVATRTAYHALVDRGRLQAGETLLVLGSTGGVGLTAVELGRLQGARVIAVGSSDERLAVAWQRGADAVVNYREQDLVDAVKSVTDGAGVDVVYDPIGGELSRASTRLLRWGGRLLVVGFASGEIADYPANHALLKGYSIVGVRAGEGARRDPAQAQRGREAMLAWAEQGHLRPHICRAYPLGQAADALRSLESRGVVGRVALRP